MLCSVSQQSPQVAHETVPIFVWLNTDHFRPWRMECWPLPFSTPLFFRRSVLWCSGLSIFRKFLKPLSTSALPSCRPEAISAVLAVNLPIHSVREESAWFDMWPHWDGSCRLSVVTDYRHWINQSYHWPYNTWQGSQQSTHLEVTATD